LKYNGRNQEKEKKLVTFRRCSRRGKKIMADAIPATKRGDVTMTKAHPLRGRGEESKNSSRPIVSKKR